MAVPGDHEADDELSTHGSMQGVLEALSRAPSELLVRGTIVDAQYRIDRVLGEGAMGIVYCARDLRLERDVAIKLARDSSPAALAQSTREALALARLSHPNVVVVYQVGSVVDRLYVAMEYVDGVTARTWCQVADRSPRDILDLYLRAGEGLAAAHAVGLVHRDFKPDNVLVGKDGRARVADFGLARDPVTAATAPPPLADGTAADTAPGALVPPHELDSTRSDTSIRSADSNTATAFVGTRAYMPPEQYRGEAIGPPADQFAFCVSLWEALHGTRPFDSVGEVADGEHGAEKLTEMISTAKLKRTPVDPRARPRQIAKHVEAALRRGMAARPGDRWPDMRALLAELRRDPERRRRRIVLAAGIAVALAGAITVVAYAIAPAPAPPPADPCAGGPARIAGTWQPGASPARAATEPHVAAQLDTWSGRWATEYRAVCESAAWTPELRERGMGCLAKAEHQLDATVATLGEKLALPAQRTALDILPDPEACADPAYLGSVAAPPTDPQLAKRFRAQQAQLGLARLLAQIGKGDRAKAIVALIAKDPVDYPSAKVDLDFTAGVVAVHTGTQESALISQFVELYFEARGIGQREVAAHAANNVALGYLDASKDDLAALWTRLAESEANAIPNDAMKAEALVGLATVAIDRSDPAKGAALADKGFQLASRGQYDGLLAIEALRTRANANDALGKPEAALADIHEAIRRITADTGDLDPRLVECAATESLALVHLDRNDEAVAAAQRGLRVATAQQPPDPMSQSLADGALGTALSHAGRLAEALVVQDRSLAVDRAMLDNTFNIASDLNNRSDLLARMKRFDEAIASAKEALHIWETTIGDSTEVGSASYNIASALRDLGRPTEAKPYAARAAAMFGKAPESSMAGQGLMLLAVIEDDTHDRAAALADNAKAIAILEKAAPDSRYLKEAYADRLYFQGKGPRQSVPGR